MDGSARTGVSSASSVTASAAAAAACPAQQQQPRLSPLCREAETQVTHATLHTGLLFSSSIQRCLQTMSEFRDATPLAFWGVL